MFTSLFDKTNKQTNKQTNRKLHLSNLAFQTIYLRQKIDYNLMDVINYKRPCENEKIGDHISFSTEKLTENNGFFLFYRIRYIAVNQARLSAIQTFPRFPLS